MSWHVSLLHYNNTQRACCCHHTGCHDMDFDMNILCVHAYICHVTGNDLNLHEHLLITRPQSYEHCDHIEISR